MLKLHIDPSKSTPLVDFDPEKHYMIISGESYPENSFKFYEPIFNWLQKYFNEMEHGKELIFEMNLSYLNTSSTKSIMNILDILEEAYLDNKKIKINWYYDKENELSYEIAYEFQEYLEIPFNLLEKAK